MSNNKQHTALEILIDVLSNYDKEMLFLFRQEIEQTKAMNKNELKSAYEDGEQNQYDKIAIENRLDINSEEWFNLKYGGNK